MPRTQIGRRDIILECPASNPLGLSAIHIPLCSGSFPYVYVKPNMDWLYALVVNTAALMTWNEIPTGGKNGTNLVFTTARTYTAGTLMLNFNGLRGQPTVDFTEGPGGDEFTMLNAPHPMDTLVVDYRYPPP